MSNLEQLAEAIAFAHEPDAVSPHAAATESLETQSPQFQALSHELERIAALAAAASSPPDAPPASLASRLAADGLAFCATASAPTASASTASTPTATDGVAGDTAAQPKPGFTTPKAGSGTGGNLLSFVVGALAAGLIVWLALSDSHERSIAELRAQALAQNPSIQRQEWQPGPSPRRGGVTGDVVWNQQEQDGWLTFRNLPALPADQAYQLWIVDGERQGDPVDGGLFTIASTEDTTVVPIQARLQIGKPAAFVITIEDKRGVVVSKQEHVVAIASL